MGVTYKRRCPRCWDGRDCLGCALCQWTGFVQVPAVDPEADTQPIDMAADEHARREFLAASLDLQRRQTEAMESIARSLHKFTVDGVALQLESRLSDD